VAPISDLHFAHPRAQGWGALAHPYDCFSGTPLPDWGTLDEGSDDPNLRLDDTNGRGPEVITLERPEDTGPLGGSYGIGVHYYRSRGPLGEVDFGPSVATVKIYEQERLLGTFQRLLNSASEFWEPARIHWDRDGARIEEVDRISMFLP
jgi:hypothetical protein